MTAADRAGGAARRVLGGVRRAADAVGRAVQDAGARATARGQRAPGRPGRGAATTPRPLSNARVADDLSRRGYRFRTDDDGDVTGTWDGNRFWFLLLGDHDEILQVRGRWAGTVPAGARLAVLQAVNDWNRERVWPKVYVRPEGDNLALYAEVSVDFEHGATDEQLAATVSCGLVTSSQFFSTVGAMTPGGPEHDDLS
ncbi:type III secretion system chaperone family protein [Krasilnikoviella flava]|uniref:Putative sensory transduction regulator n=1 Tax=Krasilnikoviella flava TaxID=526729 RepID=A0A1T5LTK9_9MICO|nr:YbjN domain-containing protein [Krasilnikoviella flava]SKC79280.1 Putative sensory transduction regulator [Krasilnikoviella flava]